MWGAVTVSLKSVLLKAQEGKLRDFCKQTGRRTDKVRTRTAGWNRSTSQKAVWDNKKAVDNAVGNGIMELNRRTSAHRRIGEKGQQIISKSLYHKLTRTFIKNGGIIIRGEQAERHLGEKYASYLPSLNAAFIRDDATVSDVLEEMYHAKQDRAKMFGSVLTDEVYLRREIDAQKYLLSVSDRYKIPYEEIQVTEGNLRYYEQMLKELLKG